MIFSLSQFCILIFGYTVHVLPYLDSGNFNTVTSMQMCEARFQEEYQSLKSLNLPVFHLIFGQVLVTCLVRGVHSHFVFQCDHHLYFWQMVLLSNSLGPTMDKLKGFLDRKNWLSIRFWFSTYYSCRDIPHFVNFSMVI